MNFRLGLRIGIGTAAAVCMACCAPSDRYWDIYDLPRGHVWQPEEHVVFECTTMGGRGDEIELFVRTEAWYNGAPLRLIVKTSRADGLYWQDTVHLVPRVTWGTVYEAHSVVRRGVRWALWEPISIGVRPADGPIEGVGAVGLAIDGAVGTNKQE